MQYTFRALGHILSILTSNAKTSLNFDRKMREKHCTPITEKRNYPATVGAI